VKNIVRGIAFLALSWLVGTAIKKVLTSSPGRGLLGRLGHAEIGTLEGADAASKKVKQGIELARSLSRPEQRAGAQVERAPTGPRWVRTLRDAAEMLLATGALLKAVSDFVREDERLRKRFGRLGSRVEAIEGP